MLRVKEVATRLKVHPATVYRWIKDGHLEAVRYGKPQVVGAVAGGPGGAIRVPESALAGFTPPSVSEVA
jgi:excisionase family DNA binding protein